MLTINNPMTEIYVLGGWSMLKIDKMKELLKTVGFPLTGEIFPVYRSSLETYSAPLR